MENGFYTLTISSTPTMAKRGFPDPHSPKPHSKAEHHGETSGYGKVPLSRFYPQESVRSVRSESFPHTSGATPSFDDFSPGDYYDGYLSTVLFDFGLQLSPGGTHVEELDQNQSDFTTDLKDELEHDRTSGLEITPVDAGAKATTLQGSKFRKITESQKIKSRTSHEVWKRGSSSPVQIAAQSPIFGRGEGGLEGGHHQIRVKSVPEINLRRSAASSSQVQDEASHSEASLPPLPELEPLTKKNSLEDPSKRKIKKYQFEHPLDDPEEERKRQNAINARRNRVKQKKLTQDLSEKNRKLVNVNLQCGKALKRTISDVQKMRLDLEERKNQRIALEQQLRKKESEVREQREQLILFRGHLDLIASSLDDDNPARKLISTLLNKLPSDSSKSSTQ